MIISHSSTGIAELDLHRDPFALRQSRLRNLWAEERSSFLFNGNFTFFQSFVNACINVINIDFNDNRKKVYEQKWNNSLAINFLEMHISHYELQYEILTFKVI